MPASYPTSTWAPTTKADGDTVFASHIDDAQTEVVAIEADLRAGLPIARGGTGATTGNTALANLFASPNVLKGTSPAPTVVMTDTGVGGGTVTYKSTGIDFVSGVGDAGVTVLDAYSEGTWTPTLRYGGVQDVGTTYTSQAGFYVKIGQLVWVTYRIVLTNKGTATGNISIGGLPFTALATVDSYGGLTSNYHQNFATLQGWLTGVVNLNQTTIALYTGNAGVNSVIQLAHGNITNTTEVIMTGCYRANA